MHKYSFIFIYMKKIIWVLILLVVVYFLLIFKAPNITTEIEKLAGFEWFTELVTSIKWNIDDAATKIPSQEELEDRYNQTVSWALHVKDNVINGIDKTKETIDNVRVTLSGAQDTISDTLDVVWSAVDKVQKAKETVDKINQSVQEVSETIESVNSTLQQ